MRVTHLLKPNKTSETPSRAIWLDVQSESAGGRGVETYYRFIHARILHGVKATGETRWVIHRYEARTAIETCRLIDSLLRAKTRTYVICEKAERVITLLDGFNIFPKRGFICSLAVLSADTLIVRWREQSRTMVWLDLKNFSGARCSTSATLWNGDETTRKCDDSNALNPEERRWHNVETISKSCVHWWSFLKTNDLGGFAMTIGSQAMRTFRHKYMTHPILVHANAEALAMERLAFKGGRCECRSLGTMSGTFTLLDLNSAYASVMHTMQVPIRFCTVSREVTRRDLEKWTATRAVIADLTLETNEPAYAVRDRERLTFPVGRIRTHLTTPEIKYALENHHISIIHAACFYDTAVAFESFVSDFWTRRASAIHTGNTSDADYYKTLLAAFFGKWAQHGGMWVKIDDTDDMRVRTWQEIIYETGEVFEYRQFGGIVQMREHEVESRESMPAIAAHVAAGVRMKLWSLMNVAGLENVLYVDTDSLLVQDAGVSRLDQYVEPNALGKLRLEGAYDHVTIYGPKDYVFGGRVRRKGVRESAEETGVGTFEQQHNVNFAGMIRDGDLSRVRERRVRKHLRRFNDSQL